MKEEILDFIHYGLKTVDLANLNREHLVNCFEELEKENADLEEKISVLLSCKNCPENKGGFICQKEYENKCLAQKIQYIKELQEENAELKKRIKTLTIHDANAVLSGLEMKVLKESHRDRANKTQDQLTTAKELLAKWVELFKPKGGNIPPTPIQVDTEQFLSEVEK